MSKLQLDMIPRIKDEINTLGLPIVCHIGLLRPGESMAIVQSPGGNETTYMDGTRTKAFNVEVNIQTTSHQTAYDLLTQISSHLENLDDLPSKNDSYEFEEIQTLSSPSIVGQGEDGSFIYTMTIKSQIFIKKGVIE